MERPRLGISTEGHETEKAEQCDRNVACLVYRGLKCFKCGVLIYTPLLLVAPLSHEDP